ncbi:type II toxin-antitoxin system VapC family toxin [Roseovarius sp. S1116L3]|uniref:type II toxin-antitoxin system VapC family toxin n=1 Tax=Roseovarius roseus TaxID=3342636 RepID=UPI0037284F8C
MTSVLLDTHAWVWSFLDDDQLSRTARGAIENADAVYVSPISFFEIGQKVGIGKWPEMAPHLRDLPDILRGQGGLTATLTPDICIHASARAWDHRDPFDRLIASTAELSGLRLISKDAVFSGLSDIHVVW